MVNFKLKAILLWMILLLVILIKIQERGDFGMVFQKHQNEAYTIKKISIFSWQITKFPTR